MRAVKVHVSCLYLALFIADTAVLAEDQCIPLMINDQPAPCIKGSVDDLFIVNAGNCSNYEDCCDVDDYCYIKDILTTDTVMLAEDQCIPLMNDTQPVPCLRGSGDELFKVNAENCSDYANCCEVKGLCFVKNVENTEKSEDTENIKKTLLLGAFETIRNSTETGERLLQIGPPIGPPGCLPPVPFPSNCKPTANEPYVLVPPTDVPYCVRIPCSSENKEALEKSHHMCGSQPGCYFDKELFEYRQAFGQSVLPGVPVCHLAIRNRVFLTEAQKVVTAYGSWNPYFTNCLLKEYKKEIDSGPQGCEFLAVLDAFKIKPKLAGWTTINARECALIDACFVDGRGCFYPVDISNVVVKSGQLEITFNNEIKFGRPRCQHFDNSSPLNILKSYHQCLSSGCSVDSSVTSLYYNHLFSIGKDLSVEQHWLYWAGVQGGNIGAYNIEETVSQYDYTPTATSEIPSDSQNSQPLVGGPFSPPQLGSPFQQPAANPFSSFLPPNHQALQLPPTNFGSGQSHSCGPAFREYKARPCAPPTFQFPPLNNYCPYKPFKVPRFPDLKGKFDGCCEINLCYLPRSEISRMHSGPTYYYSEWSLFSPCSATCGPGKKRRSRRCIAQDKCLCTEHLLEVQSCDDPCPNWGHWSSYAPCPATCFPGGIQSRTRECLPPGSTCPGQPQQVKRCNEHTCPYDPPSGTWTPWESRGCMYNPTTGMCEERFERYCLPNGFLGEECDGPWHEIRNCVC